MPSEFSSNIREIAAELKLMDRRFAAGVRKAIRVTVVDAGQKTVDAIKAKAEEQGLDRAAAATGMRVSFSVRSGGAKITTNQRKAPYARPLEQGSQGSGGAYDRHPVYGRGWVNQPTRPYFYSGAKSEERVSEETLIAAVDAACVETGFRL